MSVLFMSLNGTEITNHNRKISITENLSVSDVQTAGGRIRRFYKRTDKSLSIEFTYLPDKSAKTVDTRAGRDFLFGLAYSNPLVLVSYKDKPDSDFQEFYGYISGYQETLVRRDLKTQCSYYDVSFTIEEK